MREYISDVVQEFGEVFPQVVTSLVEKWLFAVGKVWEL